MKLSKTMRYSHMRMTLARGQQKKTWTTWADRIDPRVPMNIRLYRIRRWYNRIKT